MTTTAEGVLDQIQRCREQGGSEAAQALLRIILDDRESAARRLALKALKEIGAAEASVPALIEAVTGAARSLRMAAVEALGELGDSRAVEPLLVAMKDTEVVIRVKAIEGLGRLKDPRAVEPLTRALRDRNTAVRVVSAEALGRLGDQRAIDPLLIAMAEANNELRRAATGALGNDSQARAMAEMNRKMSDEAWLIQWAVAAALSRIGGPRASDAIIAWSHRVYTSESRKITADEKIKIVREAVEPLLAQMSEAELRTLQNKLQAATRIKSWQSLSTVTDLFDWIDAKRENPVWTAIVEELDRRRPGGPALAKSAPEPAAPHAQAPHDPLVPASRGPLPVSAPSAPPPAPAKPADKFPDPVGVTADFLAFLKAEGLESVVLVGGALRSAILGRQPNDLDIACQLMVSEDFKSRLGDPIAWNAQFAPQVHPTLSALAEKLGCHLTDLIDGKALFRSPAGEIKIHYVGPFLIEEKEATLGRHRAGLTVRQTVSRLGLVADGLSATVLGLVSTTTIDQVWIDYRSRQAGNLAQALQHLAEKKIHVDKPAPRLGLIDVFHLLFVRSVTGGALTEPTLDLLEAASAAIKQRPEIAAGEFAQADFERLVSVAGLEKVVAALDALDLTDVVAECLDESTLARIGQIRVRAGGQTPEIEAARRALADAQTEGERRKEAFEAKTLELNRQADAMDAAKAAAGDVEARLRAQIAQLGAAETQAREAAARVERATARFREMSAKGAPDLATVQEHREALAFKRERDAHFESQKGDVQTLRAEIEARQKTAGEMEARMETVGQELEAALKAAHEGQARLAEAEAAVQKLDAVLAMPRDRRRQILRDGA